MLWWTLRTLRSKDLDARSRAFAAAIRGRNLGALLRVVEDDDPYVRDEAIRALGAIGDAAAVPALLRRLDDDNFNNQEAAAAALAATGDGRAAQPLVAMLRAAARERQARCAAADALIRLADARSVPFLLDALQDRDPLARSESLRVLAVLGDGRAVPAAIAALHDPDDGVRDAAVNALGAMRDARAVDPLLALLEREVGGPGSEFLIRAIGRIGDRRAAAALAARLGDRRGDTRAAAAEVLDALGWQPPDDDARARQLLARQRWDELARLGWDRAGTPLVESLRDGDEQVRRQAVTALGRMGDPRALEPLARALQDADERIAEEAANALGSAGDARAVEPLVEFCLRYAPEGGYRNNPNASGMEQGRAAWRMATLETLTRRVAAELAPEDLRRLMSLEDKTFHLRIDYDTPGYGDGADDFTVVLDFSKVREMAAAEFRRRPG